jgi:hypothetical protein
MIQVATIEIAKELVMRDLIRCACNTIVDSGVNPDNIDTFYCQTHNENTGDRIGCMITINNVPKFTISRSLDANVVHVVIEELNTENGAASFDFIIKFDKETCMGRFEFAEIVAPSEHEIKLMLPYKYLSGMFAGYLTALQEHMMLVELPDID